MKCLNKKNFYGGLIIATVVGSLIYGMVASKGGGEVVTNVKTLFESVSDGLNNYRDEIDNKISEIQNDEKRKV